MMRGLIGNLFRGGFPRAPQSAPAPATAAAFKGGFTGLLSSAVTVIQTRLAHIVNGRQGKTALLDAARKVWLAVHFRFFSPGRQLNMAYMLNRPRGSGRGLAWRARQRGRGGLDFAHL